MQNVFHVNNNDTTNTSTGIALNWHRPGVFIVEFEQNQHTNQEFLLRTLKMYLPVKEIFQGSKQN